MRACLHPREAERLRALHETDLVGALPEALHEAVVKLASEICGTPIAAVSLVDTDRQWFSGIHGLDCRETPRELAFCAHTILGETPLVVCDATSDPRFSDNALVTGQPAIRFYAGVPLTTASNLPLGSLCVIDTSPRDIDPKQIDSLKVLAGLVASHLETLRHSHQSRVQESRLREILDRMTKIASQVPGVIYQFRLRPDGTSSFPYASDGIRQIYRVSPEQVRDDASDVFAIIHPDDLGPISDSIAQSAETLGPWHQEYRVRFADGTERWLQGKAVPEREADGGTLWHGFISDVTERKASARSLEELTTLRSAILDNAGHSIIATTPEGEITSFNRAAERMLGYTAAEMIGKQSPAIIHDPEEVAARATEFSAELATELEPGFEVFVAKSRAGLPNEHEWMYVRKDGTRFPVLLSVTALRDAKGEITGFLGIGVDITERRLAEAKVNESREVIERQNTELSVMADRAHRVVDDVSHEFRTPLAVIKEFGSIIADGIAGPVSDQQTEFLKIMDCAVVDLNHMVEDLLDSSKLRAGRLRVERRAQRVEDIFDSCLTTLTRKASSRSITLETEVDPSLPEVFADEEKVRRIIGNLVTNAVKFSPEGGVIRLTAQRGEEPGRIVVAVTDQGPGLSQEDIERLFGRFSQVSTARNSTAKGFGLGLSIAAELAQLNLGELGVESEKGKGAAFSFSLPAADPAVVLTAFMETLERGDTPADRLVLLGVRADLSGGSDAQEAAAFLASTMRPTDLILSGEAEGRWWIVGRTECPEAWAERVMESRRRLASEQGLELGALTVEAHQSWAYPSEAERARTEVQAILSGGSLPSGSSAARR